jgi:type IV secretion system protein VirD4
MPLTVPKIVKFAVPLLAMLAIAWICSGHERWLAGFGTGPDSQRLLGRTGIALPYVAAALAGITMLLASRGGRGIRSAGAAVALGGVICFVTAATSELLRLAAFSDRVPTGSIMQYVDIFPLAGGAIALVTGLFGLRVALRGDGAFGPAGPKRASGRRAVHGDSVWMSMAAAARLFPATAGIVVGERYRVDEDGIGSRPFDAGDRESWGKGGSGPLLCFDANFGSTHAIAFAGSGGFKTTSTVVPTAVRFSGSVVVLDPSSEVAPLVSRQRKRMGQTVHVLNPDTPEIGFNVLDWVGSNGHRPEEDIASVAAWLMSEKPRLSSGSDDFFRTSAEQLITAIIADVMLGDTGDAAHRPSLRMVRQRLAEPEDTLKEKLAAIYESTGSAFVREVVAPFINMTPQTFSGVYATAAKETHWLSYEHYAALVSGRTFETGDIAAGKTSVFINIDLATMENHPGLARVIIGACLKAVYNRDGEMSGRVLFLLDEAARLGYMRILETARDAGRKYGISLVLLYQSIGQMREAYGRDATSKWFESSSWVSFSAINDSDTAEYISRRCGDTTVEVDQLSRSSQMSGSSRTRSRQLTRRPLILPHEVTRMRTDEQIVFTAGNPPLRCGRAIWFRRPDMKGMMGDNRFHKQGPGHV